MVKKSWRPPTSEREEELRQQTVQYVEGYILACDDVLKDLAEIAHWSTCKVTLSQIRDKVQDSLRQARASLRLWKGTDEQAGTGTTTD